MWVNRINLDFNRIVFLFLVTIFSPQLYGQSSKPSSAPSSQSSIEVSLNRLRNSQLTPPERLAVYQDILREPPSRKQEILLRIMQESDEDFSATASRELLINHNSAVDVSTIVDQLDRRAPSYKAIVLETCLFLSAEPKNCEIAKRYLARIVDDKDLAANSADAVGVACLVLAPTADKDTSELILKAVHAYPQSRRVWLAAALAKSCGDAEVELAKQIWQDNTLEQALRIACAGAIAKHDQEAAAYVRTAIEGYLRDFASDERIGRDRPNSAEDRQRYKDFRQRIGGLAIIRFMEGSDAKDHAVKCTGAKNRLIRNVGLLTLCIRWPEMFLAKSTNGELGLDQDQRNRFLAAILFHHPDMKAQINIVATEESIDNTLTAIRRGGLVGIFGMSGSIVLGL